MCELTTLIAVGTGLNILGDLSAAEDAEDRYHAQAQASYANAQHRREVAEYNAAVIRDQAMRLRGEMANRLNEVAGINIGRIAVDAETNVSRLQTSYLTNVGRINTGLETDVTRTAIGAALGLERIDQDQGLIIDRINEMADITINRARGDTEDFIGRTEEDLSRAVSRIKEITQETISRLGRRASEVVTTGFEIENDMREQTEQAVAQTQAFYAAGNIVISSATPASMQMDEYQRGEVMAQRIRRDYAFQARDLQELASDNLRDALFQIDDLKTAAERATGDAQRDLLRTVLDTNTSRFQTITDANIDADRSRTDLALTTAWSLTDLYQDAGWKLQDLTNETDVRISDIRRNASTQILDTSRELGYDLSDLSYQADQLDQEAVLTLMQGDQQYAAEMNNAAAFEAAGDDALQAGVFNAFGSATSGLANSFAIGSNNTAPVFNSAPDFTR